jgi:hypothetical protein
MAGPATFRPLGHRIAFLVQTGNNVVGFLRERSCGLGQGALLRPAGGVGEEVRQGDMAPAFGERAITGAEAIADRPRQAKCPGATIYRRVGFVANFT